MTLIDAAKALPASADFSIDSGNRGSYAHEHDLEPIPARNLIGRPSLGRRFTSRTANGRKGSSSMSSLLSRIIAPAVRAAFHHLIRIA